MSTGESNVTQCTTNAKDRAKTQNWTTVQWSINMSDTMSPNEIPLNRPGYD